MAKVVVVGTEDSTPTTHRESPRLKAKGTKGKNVTKMSQELVAKKCGIMKEHQALDDMILKDYLNMYKQPLTEEAVETIKKLTEATENNNKKKEVKKKTVTFSQLNKKLILGQKPKKGKKEKKAPEEDGVSLTA